jgi:hypothetical protein
MQGYAESNEHHLAWVQERVQVEEREQNKLDSVQMRRKVQLWIK